MVTLPFLADFVIILAGAIAVNLLSARLKIPAVVGFLITGLLLGPSGLALISDRHTVQLFAEVGIVFLLFTVGLEFSRERMREIRRAFFLGGSLQGLGTIAAVVAIVVAAGVELRPALFFGFLVTLSSTAVVVRLLDAADELDAPQGKLALGILLFQDFLIVPMILLVPVLAGHATASAAAVSLRLALGLAVVAAVFVIARYLMPRLLLGIVRTGAREVFVLGALLVCLGLALLTESFGFSLALGAFLAGIIVSESDYSPQVIAEVTPFRDVFNSLFFISVGMLLRIEFALQHAGAVLALVLGIVVLKALLVYAAVRLLRIPVRTAAIVAVALAQVGEFSFVLARSGESAGLISDDQMQLFLAASILTLMATPLLLASLPRLVGHLPGLATRDAKAVLREHVVIVGFGMNGRSLARVLREAGIRYLAIELNGDIARTAKAAGEPILYGDATRREILVHAGIERASVAVFLISDPEALRLAIGQARALHAALRIVVRTRRVTDIERLYRVGADEVIAEEFETSIEILNRVLRHYHVPRNLVEAQEKLLRGDKYEMLRSPSGGQMPSKVLDLLASGVTDVFSVGEGSPAVGRSLASLDLRASGGATVIAVVRGDKALTNPAAELVLEAGDGLVLVGSHGEIRRGFDLLAGVDR
jgi:monovalent cation:H+ antiporter-2, CPA2 family